MSVKAKYIKDLPLKNVLDGSESLLVQDSNGTKQAPVGTIVDEIKQNGIFSMANMGQDIKEAMTGGSVAVVGKNTVLNENIVDGQISLNKLSENSLICKYYNFENLTSNADATGNWCNELLYKKGYVKSIFVKINGDVEQNGKIFLYEAFEDGSIQYRKEYDIQGFGDITVPVNEYIPYDFYISTKCAGVAYGNVSLGYKCASLGTTTTSVMPSFNINYTFAIGVNYEGIHTRIRILEDKYFDFKNRFYNKKYCALGDSITKGENSLDDYNPMIGYRYTDLAHDYFGFRETVNLGKGGSRITRHTSGDDTKYGMVDRLDTIPPDTDILCIFGGTNDFGASVEIGDMFSGDYTHFKFCLRTMIDTILRYYPNIKLYFITPLHRNDSKPDNVANSKGYTLKDYVNAIKEVCEFRGIPVLDLYNNYGITPFVESQKTMFMPDGLHPIPLGMKRLAEKNNQFIENTL